mgnify:CR=1 FL=1
MTQPGPFKRLPLGLWHLRTCVYGPGEHEEKVGQSVNVDSYRPLDNIASQCNNPALYSAAYGARQVQRCPSRRAARQNESPHLRQFFVETINPRLQPFHGSTIQIDLRNPLGYPASRVGQSRTNRKKVALHMRDDFNQVWLSQMGEHQPHCRRIGVLGHKQLNVAYQFVQKQCEQEHDGPQSHPGAAEPEEVAVEETPDGPSGF